MSKLTINPSTKLKAIAMKYYQHVEWKPQIGDLYTIVRADNEVFEIVGGMKNHIEPAELHIKTRTNMQDTPTIFPEGGFTTKDFGVYRVFIHPSLHGELEETDDLVTDLVTSDNQSQVEPLKSAIKPSRATGGKG